MEECLRRQTAKGFTTTAKKPYHITLSAGRQEVHTVRRSDSKQIGSVPNSNTLKARSLIQGTYSTTPSGTSSTIAKKRIEERVKGLDSNDQYCRTNRSGRE